MFVLCTHRSVVSWLLLSPCDQNRKLVLFYSLSLNWQLPAQEVFTVYSCVQLTCNLLFIDLDIFCPDLRVESPESIVATTFFSVFTDPRNTSFSPSLCSMCAFSFRVVSFGLLKSALAQCVMGK